MSSDNYHAADGQPATKKVFAPLDENQTEYAHELLEELHPLETTPICEAFPWLGAAVCYRQKGQAAVDGEYIADNEAGTTEKSKKVMINGKEIVKKTPKKKKNPLGDAVQQENPVAKLGFGIVAYLDMLWCLVWTFTLYTIFLLPTFMFFLDGSAYDSVQVKSSYLDTYLGNLGYSSVQCAQIPANVGRLSLSCPYGVIGEIYDYGVNTKAENKYDCMTNTNNQRCKPNTDFVASGFDAALNKESHLFEFVGQKSQFYKQLTGIGCFSEESILFVQYSCIQGPTIQHDKYNQMALAVGTSVLIALLFTISIRYMYQGGKIQQIEWDCATVTAGDYTVEFTMKAANYLTWKEQTYRASGGPFENGVAPAFALKEQMKKEIEEKLTRWVSDNRWAQEELYGKSKSKREKTQYEGTKVADIVFSFSNSRLIEALRARGACIASQDFDAMREEEQKINELFQDFDALTIPTSAFITFETDDSANFADMVVDSNDTLIGHEFKFDKCSEPTDIIWENRHFTNWDYIKRQTFAFVIIGILLFGSFIFIYWVSAFSAEMASVFPTTDCELLSQAYGGYDKMKPYAVQDYDFVQAHPTKQSSGCLQCFCTDQAKNNGGNYLTESYGQEGGDLICEWFSSNLFSVYLWTTALSYLLIGINYVLRTVCIMLVDWIGFSTETVRLSKTTTITFVVQFFNSAFLLLMTNANLSEQPLSFGLTSGKMPDFNSAWFRSVGDVIVGAMVFNVYYPIIEVLMYWGLRVLFRCMDRGCSCKGSTKSTSIQGYISVYQGPLYFMHYKYSSILTISYITFLYGFGMPVLFPIAMMSFLILYMVEKLMLFYGYVMPPMYDERLSNDVLNKLQFAPLLYVIFGYWMASNEQLLSDAHLSPVATAMDTYQTNHTMGSVFSGDGWEGIKWPLMATFIILNLVWYFGDWFQHQLYECFPNLRIGDIEINEDIDNYWAALDEEDRKWSTREEENIRENLGSKLLTDEQFEALKSTAMTSGKTLQGTHSFDILANPLYLDDFQYVPAAEDDRNDMIIDDDDEEGNDAAQSDLVRVGLNLAYMTEEKAKKFKFDKTALTELCSRLKGNDIQ